MLKIYQTKEKLVIRCITRLPLWLGWWRICLQSKRPKFNSCVEKIPWRREWQPTPAFLPGEFHGQRNLVPNRLQSMSFKESNTTESLNTNAHTVIIFKNAGSQVLNSLENSIELLLWFLILYFCYEMFFCCCSVTKFSLTLCDPMNCSMPAFHILHYHPEPAQTHVHWISDAIQPSHPLLSPSPLAFDLNQHQGLF